MNEHSINLHQIAKHVRLYFNMLDYQIFHFRWGIEVMWALEDNLEVQVGND